MCEEESRYDQAEQLLKYLEEVEQRLEHLQRGLTRSHRLTTLGTMASIIAHEFNNILTPVISYCQLARRSPDDVELLRKAIDRAYEGASKAAQISNSMLGFAREAHDQPTADVARIVEEVFNCLAREPKKDGIDLQINIPTHCHVALSPVSLQQVLMNLVLNARRAMRPGGGRLAITASMDDQHVRIEVVDSGCGMSEEVLPHIFEPFFTKAGDSQNEPGTGLGLVVCRDLVQRAEGSIDVESKQGVGTRFTITLPRAGSATRSETDADALKRQAG
jgi:signal transduction histidine kinase